MSIVLRKGRYLARFAETDQDMAATQGLRQQAFRASSGQSGLVGGPDVDCFDPICRHVLIESMQAPGPGSGADRRLVGSFRVQTIGSGRDIGQSYAARFYGLSSLAHYQGRMVEMGRFCTHPEVQDADVLRIAWAALTRYVDEAGAGLLFGCSSFRGTDAARYGDTFELLAACHLGPPRWLPGVKAPKVVRFAAEKLRRQPDRIAGLRRMPPLLRSYLSMGGWVSDHAVIDDDLGTLHVFTGLEVARIPAARVRSLRAVAG